MKNIKTNIKKNKDTEIINNTKSIIINCAGELIAKYGYDRVTSKSICEKAKVNIAAINYHFGSYDGLYIIVLKEVHKYLLSIEELSELYLDNLTAKEKIERFIDIFIENYLNKNNWYINVWVREIINPTPFIEQILSQEAVPKLNIVSKIFSEYTNIPSSDPMLYSCIINSISPFMVIFLTHNTTKMIDVEKMIGIKSSRKELISNLKKFIFIGLDGIKI